MNEHQVASPQQWLWRAKSCSKKRRRSPAHAMSSPKPPGAALGARPKSSTVFEGPSGPESAGRLFAVARSWSSIISCLDRTPEVGCKSCSFWAGNFNGAVPHLAARDVTLVAVSRAPLSSSRRSRSGWLELPSGCRRA